MDSKARDRKKRKIARQIRASAAIGAAYQKRLLEMTEEMHKSVMYWITANYREQEARIAGDASPSEVLQKALSRLVKQWEKRLSGLPGKMAAWFAEKTDGYTSRGVAAALKEAGFTVKLGNSRRVNDILRAAINQNVSLIRSIPEQYLSRVEDIVQRGMMAGRNMGYIREELQKNFDVTRTKAIVIARDQTNKATQAMTKARYEELGITRAIWQHNAGGKTFRKSHVDMNGKEFDLEKGMWDPAAQMFIQPGEFINCRCSYRPVLPEYGSAGKKEAAA